VSNFQGGGLNIHEEEFARAFIVPAKRERYLSMLGSPKARARLVAAFPHCRDLNMEHATLIPAGRQSRDDIETMLRQRGAPDSCHVISSDREIDNQDMSLSEALEETVGMNMGTFISCIPGRLGYFEFEDLGERYIFAR
jgi:hypothetical protein